MLIKPHKTFTMYVLTVTPSAPIQSSVIQSVLTCKFMPIKCTSTSKQCVNDTYILVNNINLHGNHFKCCIYKKTVIVANAKMGDIRRSLQWPSTFCTEVKTH